MSSHFGSSPLSPLARSPMAKESITYSKSPLLRTKHLMPSLIWHQSLIFLSSSWILSFSSCNSGVKRFAPPYHFISSTSMWSLLLLVSSSPSSISVSLHLLNLSLYVIYLIVSMWSLGYYLLSRRGGWVPSLHYRHHPYCSILQHKRTRGIG